MIRFCGMALTALSALLFGALSCAHWQNECRQLESFLRLARLIRTRIECFHQPLAKIYADFSDPSLNSSGFIASLRENGLITALIQTKDRLGLSEESFSLLSEFAAELGKSPADDQVRHCDRSIRALEERYQQLRQDLPTKMRLARTLSAAAAAMTIILLL
ncbi:MAG: hypothetical protein E7618_00845 [Ruminococcaceae bacterium]|nr:hypothetical protein [Oscillospiraceae bacterium]